jgi:hypothetical protein
MEFICIEQEIKMPLTIPTITPLEVSLTSLSVSLSAFCIGIASYRRKSGMFIRGNFATASSKACDDYFVSEIILENLKDRAATIFAIYVKFGHSYYIELEKLEDKPLLLKAYETYRKEFGPIEFYGLSNKRIKLNALFEQSIPKRIVLSTSEGKYTVPTNLRRWNPVHEFFSNYMTAIVKPVPSKYKDVYLGSNIAYVVEFVAADGTEQIVPIQKRDYEVRIFKNFSLTKESLENKEALEQLLHTQVNQGNLLCQRFTVYDVDAWRADAHEFYSGKTVQAEYHGRFRYYLMGKLSTKYWNWQARRKNMKARKLSQQNNGGPKTAA